MVWEGREWQRLLVGGREDLWSTLQGANSALSEWYVWFSPLIISLQLLGVGCLLLGSLQQASYSTAEGNGSLSVCVLINSTAERDVVVSLVAISLTAQGRVYYAN